MTHKHAHLHKIFLTHTHIHTHTCRPPLQIDIASRGGRGRERKGRRRERKREKRERAKIVCSIKQLPMHTPTPKVSKEQHTHAHTHTHTRRTYHLQKMCRPPLLSLLSVYTNRPRIYPPFIPSCKHNRQVLYDVKSNNRIKMKGKRGNALAFVFQREIFINWNCLGTRLPTNVNRFPCASLLIRKCLLLID